MEFAVCRQLNVDGGGRRPLESTVSVQRESHSMPLVLRIENEDRLPDGGPLFVEVFGRGLDLGRDQHLDWTLPDPSRFISGKHCEIRYRNGEYILNDVSTNGTYLAGSDQRIQSPYRLRDGDRLTIGHYIVSVSIRDEVADSRDDDIAAVADALRQNPWQAGGEVAPPVAAREFMPAPAMPRSDPLDWVVDIPPPPPIPSFRPPEPPSFAPPPPPDAWNAPPPTSPSPTASPPTAPSQVDDWLGPPPPTAAPPEPVAMPTPRRPAPDIVPAPPAVEDWTIPAAPPIDGAGGSVPIAASNPLPPGPLPPMPMPIPVPMPGQPEPLPPGPMPPTPMPTAPASAISSSETIVRIARAAGIPEDVLARRTPDEMADEIGQVLRLVTENLRQMLVARAETKSLVRSSSHTVIKAFDNNPLKFTPSSEEALRIMFGPPSRNYLGAGPAVEQGFSDLKRHQAETYSAMQSALEMLLKDLAPGAIESATEADKGIGGLVGSRKAKLWDTFAARWRALSQRSDERLLDAFMRMFAESYDRLQGDRR
ncbi:MAG TPA: type VI secretion system-associated FHA domain protein TagH [Methylomirabilota bacterium]|nr:type VI secretion system-associated FHA domain protein TagH [Methylomirabilota bacterium]